MTNRMWECAVLAVFFVLFPLTSVIAAFEKNGPPPGKWEFNRTEFVSGENTRLELRYTNGNQDLPPGSYFKFDLEAISIKQIEHAPLSENMKVIPYIGALPEVEIEQKPVVGVGYIPIKLKFPKGIKAGQSFALLIGNPVLGQNLTAIINPVPVTRLSFNILSDLEGKGAEVSWFDMGWQPNLPFLTIRPAKPSALRIFGPTLVNAGSKFSIKIAVVDQFDSPGYPEYEGDVIVVPLKGVVGLPSKVRFTAADRCSKEITNVSISKPGVYRVKMRIAGSPKTFESNPIVVRNKVQENIYWGVLHGHSYYSECWGDGPSEYYRLGRDIAGMDFLALSDHIGVTPDRRGSPGRLYPFRFGKRISGLEAWIDTVNTANKFYRPGKFVTLAGYEGLTQSAGHNNVYWADCTVENYHKMFHEKIISFPCQNTEVLGKKADLLIIPHVHATYVPYNEYYVGKTVSGYPLTPVIECYSDWGMAFPGPGEIDPHFGGVREPRAVSFPNFIGRGLKLGVVGDSDTHTGIPGRRLAAGISVGHCYPQGLTAVRARELTRQGIISGYRARKTYATNGERIFLEFSVNDIPMGQSGVTDKPLRCKIEFAGTDQVKIIRLHGANGIISEKSINGQRDGLVFFDLPAPEAEETPLFAELIQKDGYRAWSSPVWVGKLSLPDLTWEKTAVGKLCLVNRGRAVAKNISVMADPKQHSFVKPEIELKEPFTEKPCGILASRRWNDSCATYFFYWKGNSISGKLKVSGYKEYYVEPNRGLWWHGICDEQKNGIVVFKNDGGRVPTTPELTAKEWRGLGITVKPKLNEECKIVFDFDQEAIIYANQEKMEGKRITVAVNLINKFSEAKIFRIDSLKPGEKWFPPKGAVFLSADPLNEIKELNENNNLHVIQ